MAKTKEGEGDELSAPFARTQQEHMSERADARASVEGTNANAVRRERECVRMLSSACERFNA